MAALSAVCRVQARQAREPFGARRGHLLRGRVGVGLGRLGLACAKNGGGGCEEAEGEGEPRGDSEESREAGARRRVAWIHGYADPSRGAHVDADAGQLPVLPRRLLHPGFQEALRRGRHRAILQRAQDPSRSASGALFNEPASIRCAYSWKHKCRLQAADADRFWDDLARRDFGQQFSSVRSRASETPPRMPVFLPCAMACFRLVSRRCWLLPAPRCGAS